VQTYRSQVGVREATGKNDGPQVAMYLKSAGLGEGYPWCAAFVNWVHLECGYKTVQGPAWSPSWFPASRVIYVRDAQNKYLPVAGDVFGIWFNNLGRIAHVGFVDDWNGGNFFVTVEGNTNEGGSREGDGVYRKKRLKRQAYKISRFH
jgi:hypothetical protein